MKNRKSDQGYPPDELTGLAISGLKYAFFVASIRGDIFTKLKGKKITLNQFSKIISMPLDSARALVQNLSNMNLLLYKDGIISNSKLSNKYLTDDKITKQLMLWLSDYSPAPEKLLTVLHDPPKQPWYTLKEQKYNLLTLFQNKPINEDFYIAPHDLRVRWGRELGKKYDFSKHKMLLDIGGACGGWSIGILEQYPNLEAIIFERQEVIEISTRIINTYTNLKNRIRVISGDFFNDQLPDGCDVVLLANILHDWSITDCKKILNNVIDSVKPGAAILVNEFYFEDNWNSSNYGALQAMLVLGPENRSGWQPSYDEMEDLLQKIGFRRIKRQNNLVIGYKR